MKEEGNHPQRRWTEPIFAELASFTKNEGDSNNQHIPGPWQYFFKLSSITQVLEQQKPSCDANSEVLLI